ncbi:MAG: type IV pilus twitching motility protein PilT [Gemmatimonadetes bacterium]|nr:type IV pilus twitching motility protein PilT [Gemmatimonadota bacterium]
MGKINELLRHLKETDGSDLHLVAGLEPRTRRKGALEVIDGWPVLSDEQVREMMQEITTAGQWDSFAAEGDLDFAYGLPGVARFRANYFLQRRGAGAVFRIIPEDILTTEQLGLPEAVVNLANLDQGLALITGPTGSGKSTTLAAIVDKINRTYTKHIVTIEDPVEFVHTNNKSIISHREVGRHTNGFGPALRGAIRQDADVILVGEMRDLETIALAITAAQMGALVFGTLHTNNATKTIDRIIDAFPAAQQSSARTSLATSLAAVVSQLLLPTADGEGRCAVYEILLRTPALPNVIRTGNTPMLTSLIQGGRTVGMQMMDDSLLNLVREGRITAEEAMRKAVDKTPFERLATSEGSPDAGP